MLIAAKRLIVGDGKTELQNGAVRLDGRGSIGDIGTFAELVKKYPDDEVQDYGDATILPGLIDMHVHTGYWWSEPDADSYRDDPYRIAYFALDVLNRALRTGVTTVRDVSSPGGCLRGLRWASAERGYLTLPRIVHCGRGICFTGGHGWPLVGGVVEADGCDNLRAAIRRELRDGADWIKILTSHRTHTPEYTQEELNAAVDECHRRGVKICVHAGTHPSIQMCIDTGFDTIEHGTFMTREQAVQMRDKGIAWVPTIIAYTYIYEQLCDAATREAVAGGIDGSGLSDFDYFKAAAEAYRHNFKLLADTGVTVLAGTDMVLHGAPVMPVARELAYMVEYGLGPLQAIAAATGNAAAVLGLQNKTGMLKEGLCADILVAGGDVLHDIAALGRPLQVYRAGRPML